MSKVGILVVLVMVCELAGQLFAVEPPSKVSSRPIARDFVRPVFIGFSEKELDILDSLEQKVSAEFMSKPLSEALALLARRYEIPIRIEQLALDDAGISADEKVTTKQTNRKLRAVLSQLLKPLDLGWVVDQDSVVITTADQCFPINVIAVYPVSDLTRKRTDPGELSKMIRSGTNSMWEDRGGAGGSIRYVRGSRSLIIAQPLHVQYEIIHVLACLRAGQRISRKLATQKQ